MGMWIEGNYRRNLMDMHIDDWDETFLSKIDCDEYVQALVDAGVQAAMVKASRTPDFATGQATSAGCTAGSRGMISLAKWSPSATRTTSR